MIPRARRVAFKIESGTASDENQPGKENQGTEKCAPERVMNIGFILGLQFCRVSCPHNLNLRRGRRRVHSDLVS